MKFMALVKNELIKLFSHKSTVVILSIILAVTVLWSAIDISDLENLFSGTDDGDLPRTSCYVESAEKEYEENKLRAEKAGVSKDDWRANYYTMIQDNTNQYYQYIEWINEINVINDMTESTESTESNESVKAAEAAEPDKYYTVDDEAVGGKPEDQKKMYQEQADALRATINEYWEAIEKNDYTSVLKEASAFAEERIRTSSERLSEFRAVIALQNATDGELRAYDRYVKDVERLSDYIRRAYASGINNGIKGSPAVNNEASALRNAANSLPADGYITDKETFEEELHRYESLGVDPEYKSYTEYLEAVRKELAEPIQNAAIAGYAFEHGVIEMTAADSTRNKYRGILTFSLFEFVALFGIFIAGNIVSSEYSRKTINMLVIRPVSRAKILLSKYVACIITAYGLAVVGLVLSWLFCGFRYGFSDYFRPYLWFNGESVSSVPYLVWFLGRAAIGSVGFLFITTMAFGFSNLTKNTAVSIIIPTIIYSFSGVVNLFITMMFPKFATYWPFTYLELWSHVYHTVPILHRGENLADIIEMINGAGTYNIAYGAAVLIALTALIYVLSDLLFRKRDVK